MRRKTEAEKRLHGTARPDRAPAATPADAGPRLPRGFAKRDPAAARWWKELEKALPWLSLADGPALYLLAQHLARADEAAALMAAAGVSAVDRVHGGGDKRTPAALVWARESAAAAKLLGALGATVSTRPSRPAVDSQESLAELLFGMVSE